MRAHGPDGRVWEIRRRPENGRFLAGLLPGTVWVVVATTGQETRMWRATSRGDANRLVSAVAMALRTGGPSPAGEFDVDELAARRPRPDEGEGHDEAASS